MHGERIGIPPGVCPACAAPLQVTRLQCPACGTEIGGRFAAGRLVSLPEPHASLLELFLRVRGNVKEMERAMGLSYPTVRARLEEALAAARARYGGVDDREDGLAAGKRAERQAILSALERGELTAREASRRLRRLKSGTEQRT